VSDVNESKRKQSKPRIGLVDYGAGNLFSIRGGLEAAGARARTVKTEREIDACDALVVPGVGAFGPAMKKLEPLRKAINEFAASGKPLLGICLGLQVFFESSDESPGARGFDFFSGECKRFPPSVKIPQIGWNSLEINPECPLFEGVASGEYAYFVNSYYAKPSDESVIAAETDYGVRFASAVWRANVFATQFHPEKSGAAGIAMLKNFVNLAELAKK
jgi:glutamine amidotransferase